MLQHRYVQNVEYVSKTSPSKKECEDACILNETLGIYGVLDGSTPMDDFIDEDGHNGAYLAANLLKNYFESLTTSSSLHQEVIRANHLLKNKMADYHIDQAQKHRLWCTCISAVQIQKNSLYYASLGDTMILTRDRAGIINVLTVNTVKNVSARARITREMERCKGQEVPDERYYQVEKNRLVYNRYMANVPNGYSVANGMEEVREFIQYGMLDTTELTHVLICSDGLFDPQGDIRQVYWEIEEKGLSTYIEEQTVNEQANGMQSDDKTAVWITF